MCYHPSGRYIRFLLAEAWKDEERPVIHEWVANIMTEWALPPLTEKVFEKIRSNFSPPEGFRFSNHKDTITQDFMKSQKISAMWEGADDNLNRVYQELLPNRSITELVNILLMGDVPNDKIAELVSRRLRINPGLTTEMIEYYRHYFWYPPAWSTTEWIDHISVWSNSDNLLASLRCGAQQALFRAGLNPKYDPKLALRDAHRQISFRIQHLAYCADTKLTVDLLSKLCREERALYERLYGEGSSLLEEAKEARRFMIEHKLTDIKGLEDFTREHGGSYSKDGTKESAATGAEVEQPVDEEVDEGSDTQEET
jgi:hypothetical protein